MAKITKNKTKVAAKKKSVKKLSAKTIENKHKKQLWADLKTEIAYNMSAMACFVGRPGTTDMTNKARAFCSKHNIALYLMKTYPSYQYTNTGKKWMNNKANVIVNDDGEISIISAC